LNEREWEGLSPLQQNLLSMSRQSLTLAYNIHLPVFKMLEAESATQTVRRGVAIDVRSHGRLVDKTPSANAAKYKVAVLILLFLTLSIVLGYTFRDTTIDPPTPQQMRIKGLEQEMAKIKDKIHGMNNPNGSFKISGQVKERGDHAISIRGYAYPMNDDFSQVGASVQESNIVIHAERFVGDGLYYNGYNRYKETVTGRNAFNAPVPVYVYEGDGYNPDPEIQQANIETMEVQYEELKKQWESETARNKKK
jgi:hypothetical protein